MQEESENLRSDNNICEVEWLLQVLSSETCSD
jgi:hypothetical protein